MERLFRLGCSPGATPRARRRRDHARHDVPGGGCAAEDSGEMPFSAGDVGLVRTVWEASVVTTARFRWDAGGPLQTLRTGRTSPAREPPLFAERGFANIDQATSELWLLGQSPLASRFVPLDARGLLARVVHQAKDGRWLVAMGGTAQVQLVVAGDGGLAASAPGAAGLRCDPLLSE